MTSKIAIAAALVSVLAGSAAPAKADVILTPFVGSLFGGDLPDSRTSYGGSAAFMGAGVLGAEVGFTYTPSFQPATLTAPQVHQASLMGNLILGIPINRSDEPGHLRPYVTAGMGLFRATAKESDFFDRVTSNDFAVNVGGGIMAFFTEHVGVRGDVRYVRTLADDDPDGIDFDFGDLDFWKWDIGAAFRF